MGDVNGSSFDAGAGDDIILAGGGDDTIVWNVTVVGRQTVATSSMAKPEPSTGRRQRQQHAEVFNVYSNTDAGTGPWQAHRVVPRLPGLPA